MAREVSRRLKYIFNVQNNLLTSLEFSVYLVSPPEQVIERIKTDLCTARPVSFVPLGTLRISRKSHKSPFLDPIATSRLAKFQSIQ